MSKWKVLLMGLLVSFFAHQVFADCPNGGPPPPPPPGDGEGKRR